MGKLRFKLGSVIAVFMAALAFGAAPAAAASAPATLETTRWLTSSPNAGMAPVVIHRDIYLAGATYNWQVYTCRDGYICIDPGRNIDLAPGWYSWDCTLTPLNGYYYQTCSLQTGGWPKATFDKAIQLANSGNYDIGSMLQAE
ncbi:hypothetical protein [Streptomyces sp. WAC06614]|uniref:hypothetical protein n=1 Tax=Streptomyces sp. WAC06614 TaxID=2487416 RepID=UPI000F7B4EFB|nr:hypothetical protein [Streptomyces sp. WAC06614]RSS78885.1 hypothetical protein EF918_19390 [Streptomyces sp. WAC06614]